MPCEEKQLGPDEPEKEDAASAMKQEYQRIEVSKMIQQWGWIAGDRDPITGEWRTP